MIRAARPLLACLLLAVGPATLPACAARTGSYAPADPVRRDTSRAESLTRQAAALIDSDPARAERLLREALTADLYHGPAHNNLGVLYLNAGRLYEAAGEFEWARKLMPGHPDPRLNLGLALERGGRIDEALDAYRSALTAAPEHLPTLQALARCQLRHDRPDMHTPRYLELIAMRSEPEWRVWARERMLVSGTVAE